MAIRRGPCADRAGGPRTQRRRSDVRQSGSGWRRSRLSLAYWFLGKHDEQNAKSVLGLDDNGFKAFLGGQIVPLGSNTLRALVTGTSIPRDLWETAAYREAALLICYGSGEREAATKQWSANDSSRSSSPQPSKPNRRLR
jgi:hypothetical protein